MGVVKEISKKVGDIQNQILGETKIRELNDDINKLIREKNCWEKRIYDLGGPKYSSLKNQLDICGGIHQDLGRRSAGYRYFGAARNLPGVKELFEKRTVRTLRRTRQQISAGINKDYYGFSEEDDGILVMKEIAAEEKLRRVFDLRLVTEHEKISN